MKKIMICQLLCLLLTGMVYTVNAQVHEWPSPEAEQMYNQGMNSLSRGNAQEAIAIFQKTLQVAPRVFAVHRSLAQAYQVAGEHTNAIKVLDPLFAAQEADAECYRIAGQAYAGNNDFNKARKILHEGIGRHAKAGMLYYELGVLYEKQDDLERALKSWLDGIANDENYHLNYFEAAMAYMRTDNAIWPIIYGEIFVNKEPNTQRGFQARILLLDAYKKLFFTPSKNVTGEKPFGYTPATFDEAVKQTYLSLFFVVSDGITTENLTMLRSRFIISWKNNFASRYPFSLFDYQENLMRNGYFDAYNQWLFKVENPKSFELWSASFSEDMARLQKNMAADPLKMAQTDDYNRQRNFKNMFPAASKEKR